MHTSKNCLEIIKYFEGFRSKAYKCPAGVWTIGYGHTKNVKPADTVTESEASELLLRDVLVCEDVVNRIVTKTLNQGQYDACIDFIFNLGAGNFKKSTLLKKINAGDFTGASKEFGKWIYAGGKKLTGLVRRRAAEELMFTLGNYNKG